MIPMTYHAIKAKRTHQEFMESENSKIGGLKNQVKVKGLLKLRY